MDQLSIGISHRVQAINDPHQEVWAVISIGIQVGNLSRRWEHLLCQQTSMLRVWPTWNLFSGLLEMSSIDPARPALTSFEG